MDRLREASKNLPIAVLCVIALFVFFPVVHYGFVNWDDIENFIQNPLVKGFSGTSHWIWPWTARLLDVYQPIAWIFLQAQYALAPANPASFIHTVSLLLHISNSVLVFVLCSKFLKSAAAPAKMAALCGALYFALHPLQCETIAWASAQPYLLAAFFGGLSVLCFLKSQETPEKPENAVWYRVSLVLFALSLLSKSILVPLPAILAILRYTRDPAPRLKLGLLARDWLFWLFSAIALALALWASVNPPENAVSWFEAAKLAPAYLGFFIVKTFLPIGLSPLYHTSLAGPTDILLGVSLLVGIVLCLTKQKLRPFGILLAALVVLLSPGIIRAITVGNLFSDRYAYLPNAVIALIVSTAIYRTRSSRIPLLVPSALCAVLISAGLGMSSRAELAHWSDSMSLWQNAVQNGASHSYKAHNILGALLADRGNFDDAITHYRLAIEWKSEASEAHNNLAIALASKGQLGEAIAEYERALEIRPGFAEAHNNLGIALAREGKTDEAIKHYQTAIELSPDFVQAHDNLGNALTARGQYEEAVHHFQRVLEITPDDANVQNSLGVALARQGRIEEAIGHFQRALQIDPNHENARRNLQVARSTGN